jgi:hypothetical protein
MKLTAHVDAAKSQVDGNKMMMKSPGALVPMTGATSVVEIELVKADQGSGAASSASSRTGPFPAETDAHSTCRASEMELTECGDAELLQKVTPITVLPGLLCEIIFCGWSTPTL